MFVAINTHNNLEKARELDIEVINRNGPLTITVA